MKKEIVYNLEQTYKLINRNSDFREMFENKFNIDIDTVFVNDLDVDMSTYIAGIFDFIISSKALTKQYLLIGSEINVAPKKRTKKQRWGLKAIDSDIKENFNGNDTQLHRTAKQVQELKKMYTNLESRLFRERFNNVKLSETELRNIGGAISRFKTKLDSILK